MVKGPGAPSRDGHLARERRAGHGAEGGAGLGTLTRHAASARPPMFSRVQRVRGLGGKLDDDARGHEGLTFDWLNHSTIGPTDHRIIDATGQPA